MRVLGWFITRNSTHQKYTFEKPQWPLPIRCCFSLLERVSRYLCCFLLYRFHAIIIYFELTVAITVQHEQELIIVDEWIKFNAPARIAVLVKEIRNEFLQLLDAKIKEPSFDVSTSDLVDVVTKLIMNDGFL
jgi:hypothetical protein